MPFLIVNAQQTDDDAVAERYSAVTSAAQSDVPTRHTTRRSHRLLGMPMKSWTVFRPSPIWDSAAVTR